jgi:hypothetical protein
MKNNIFKISANNKFQTVNSFLRKQLGLKPGDPLVRRLSRLPHPSRVAPEWMVNGAVFSGGTAAFQKVP